MSFSTWPINECDKPDLDALDGHITTLARQGSDILYALMGPMEASMLWMQQQHTRFTKWLKRRATEELKRLDQTVFAVMTPLLLVADAAIGELQSASARMAAALQAAGHVAAPPVAPSQPAPAGEPVGRSFPTAPAWLSFPGVPETYYDESTTELTATVPYDLPPEAQQPAPAASARRETDAETAALLRRLIDCLRSVLCDGRVTPRMAAEAIREVLPMPAEEDDGGTPVDIDTPAAFLFGEQNEEWVRRASEWFPELYGTIRRYATAAQWFASGTGAPSNWTPDYPEVPPEAPEPDTVISSAGLGETTAAPRR